MANLRCRSKWKSRRTCLGGRRVLVHAQLVVVESADLAVSLQGGNQCPATNTTMVCCFQMGDADITTAHPRNSRATPWPYPAQYPPSGKGANMSRTEAT
eukprot:1231055-Prorocentrum_lima.AAC.1